MNCVPGMVTQFAFRPIMTTDEMRQTEHMIEKVANINKIRAKKSIELVANGESPLDPYTFDYLLLCNKICGASHYNMQMKIVVDTPEEYQDWLKSQKTIVNAIADEKAAKAAESTPVATTVVIKKVDSAKVAVVATPVAVK